MNGPALSQEQIVAEAADWFACLRDAQVSQAEHDEFAGWLLRSPAHIQEYLAIARRWNDISAVSDEDWSTEKLVQAACEEQGPQNVIEWKRPGSGPGTQSAKADNSRLLRHRSVRVAAVLGACVIGVTAWLFISASRHPSHLATIVGEQRSLTLSDGSILYLNTDSDARIELSARERRIVLARGEARFTVAKDPARPFLVTTPQATVRAVGTVFNVRADPAGTAVSVLEGRVDVIGSDDGVASSAIGKRMAMAGSAHVPLKAGEHVAVTSAGKVVADSGVAMERALAWPERRLVFRDDTLADVVAEYNRYLPLPLRIEDATLAGLRISGTFNAGNPRSLLQYLERYEHVRLREGSGDSVLTAH